MTTTEQQRRYRISHREEYNAYQRMYREEHKEKILASNRQSYQNNKEKRQREARETYWKNPEYQRAHQKKVRMRRKLEVVRHYSNGTMKCNCCGEDKIEFLTLEHPNKDGQKQREGIGDGGTYYNWLIQNNFPHKLEVLCFNCNTSR